MVRRPPGHPLMLLRMCMYGSRTRGRKVQNLQRTGKVGAGGEWMMLQSLADISSCDRCMEDRAARAK